MISTEELKLATDKADAADNALIEIIRTELRRKPDAVLPPAGVPAVHHGFWHHAAVEIWERQAAGLPGQTRKNPADRGLAGLVGKKIAVNGTGSIGTLLISALLAENGIAPAKVRFVTDKQGFPDMAGQLQRGQWDAAFLAEPYAYKAEEDYGQVELADLDQGATLNFPICGFVATQAWARQHPQAAAAFVRAIEEGQALAEDNPGAARRPWEVRSARRGDRGHGAARLPRRPG